MISPLPGVTVDQAGRGDAAAPGHRRRGRRRRRQAGAERRRRLPGAHRAVAGDAARRSGATTSGTRTPTGRASQRLYFAGDGAKKDEDGDIWLLGRVDDVMNVSGHRISTTEVESALVSPPEGRRGGGRRRDRPDHRPGHRRVRHPARLGRPTDEASGEALVKELRDHVAKEIGTIAKPRQIMVVPELPKTRSGKIMRRLLRDVAEQPRARRRHHADRLLGDGPDQGEAAERGGRGLTQGPLRSPGSGTSARSAARCTRRLQRPRCMTGRTVAEPDRSAAPRWPEDLGVARGRPRTASAGSAGAGGSGAAILRPAAWGREPARRAHRRRRSAICGRRCRSSSSSCSRALGDAPRAGRTPPPGAGAGPGRRRTPSRRASGSSVRPCHRPLDGMHAPARRTVSRSPVRGGGSPSDTASGIDSAGREWHHPAASGPPDHGHPPPLAATDRGRRLGQVRAGARPATAVVTLQRGQVRQTPRPGPGTRPIAAMRRSPARARPRVLVCDLHGGPAADQASSSGRRAQHAADPAAVTPASGLPRRGAERRPYGVSSGDQHLHTASSPCSPPQPGGDHGATCNPDEHPAAGEPAELPDHRWRRTGLGGAGHANPRPPAGQPGEVASLTGWSALHELACSRGGSPSRRASALPRPGQGAAPSAGHVHTRPGTASATRSTIRRDLRHGAVLGRARRPTGALVARPLRRAACSRRRWNRAALGGGSTTSRPRPGCTRYRPARPAAGPASRAQPEHDLWARAGRPGRRAATDPRPAPPCPSRLDDVHRAGPERRTGDPGRRLFAASLDRPAAEPG